MDGQGVKGLRTGEGAENTPESVTRDANHRTDAAAGLEDGPQHGRRSAVSKRPSDHPAGSREILREGDGLWTQRTLLLPELEDPAQPPACHQQPPGASSRRHRGRWVTAQ